MKSWSAVASPARAPARLVAPVALEAQARVHEAQYAFVSGGGHITWRERGRESDHNIAGRQRQAQEAATRGSSPPCSHPRRFGSIQQPGARRAVSCLLARLHRQLRHDRRDRRAPHAVAACRQRQLLQRVAGGPRCALCRARPLPPCCMRRAGARPHGGRHCGAVRASCERVHAAGACAQPHMHCQPGHAPAASCCMRATAQASRRSVTKLAPSWAALLGEAHARGAGQAQAEMSVHCSHRGAPVRTVPWRCSRPAPRT